MVYCIFIVNLYLNILLRVNVENCNGIVNFHFDLNKTTNRTPVFSKYNRVCFMHDFVERQDFREGKSALFSHYSRICKYKAHKCLFKNIDCNHMKICNLRP